GPRTQAGARGRPLQRGPLPPAARGPRRRDRGLPRGAAVSARLHRRAHEPGRFAGAAGKGRRGAGAPGGGRPPGPGRRAGQAAAGGSPWADEEGRRLNPNRPLPTPASRLLPLAPYVEGTHDVLPLLDLGPELREGGVAVLRGEFVPQLPGGLQLLVVLGRGHF